MTSVTIETKETVGNRPIGVAGYLGHLGFALEPSILELSSRLVEERPIKGKGGEFRGDGRDERDASGCGGREPRAGEVETPFGSAAEKASPDRIILSICTPSPGYCTTGDDRVQVEEAEEVNREFGRKSCNNVHCGCKGVDIDETGLVVDQFALLSV